MSHSISSATIQQLDDALAFLSKTGRGPAPPSPYDAQAWIMSNVHGMMINGLKHIYVTGPTIQPKDYDDFVGYCLIWYSLIDSHHALEEAWYFPTLQPAIPLSLIEGEHAEFHDSLEAIGKYLVECLPGGTPWGGYKKSVPHDSPNHAFDAAKLNLLIDVFVPAFTPHFCAEIGYLEPAKLREKLTDDTWKALDKRIAEEVPKMPKAFFVYELLHVRSKYFPPAPWIIKAILIPWILYWPERRFWRFAPEKGSWDD
ncbi:hypothetical protein DL93DRAFT_1221186 [Clavulina sp. PMI_390]|nr:hypothetical protein DL93DRAFT_1221186 [Clavulina sp. PMI_390]